MRYYFTHPKTGNEHSYSYVNDAISEADFLANRLQKLITVREADTGKPVHYARWAKAPKPAATHYRANPSRLTNAARQASYYFDDPRTGERRFDNDMERLKRSAARVANEVGKAIGIFTAAATGPTRKGKKR